MCLRFFNWLAYIYARLLGLRYSWYIKKWDMRVYTTKRAPFPGMAGMTIGDTLITIYNRRSKPERYPFFRHEHKHQEQWHKLRCLFPLVYFFHSLASFLQTGNPYFYNKLEIEAREAEGI